jgi:hypothetical protein
MEMNMISFEAFNGSFLRSLDTRKKCDAFSESGTILLVSHVCPILWTERRNFFVSPPTELHGENGKCVGNLTRGVAGQHTESGKQP